jgi:hypothetical protein
MAGELMDPEARILRKDLNPHLHGGVTHII